MLVPLLVYRVVQVALLAIAVACTCVIWFRRRQAGQHPAVPVARVDRPTRRFIARVAPMFSILAALAGLGQLHAHATDVVVINPDMRASRAIYVGSREYYTRMPRRDEFDIELPRNPTWIVNESHRTVLVAKVYYGPEKGVPIGPGELGVAPSVDYLGPEDKPPPGGAHQSSLFSKPKSAFVSWLTW